MKRESICGNGLKRIDILKSNHIGFACVFGFLVTKQKRNATSCAFVDSAIKRLLCHRDRNHQHGKKESKIFHYQTFKKVHVQ